jgi:hypothetical protein
MSQDKVTYTFVKEEGNIHFRSKVNSFNLDHVTDKDIVSFYQNFSNFAAYDTGLLPVDGSGMLALRRAGDHTQVTYQHKPGMYYVNWGSYEGDKSAKSYLVAQPYRIVIIDFVNDNLLGARTFYSPIPATHPGIPLYHVNLPNINCRGYRGNGVGWICLYHNADWSSMPFNERLARALERCSGIETYNDQNMSETDGPRFYKSHYSDSKTYLHLWDPNVWETKSQEEGFEWTLDENLWIPIKVIGRDQQDAHYDGEDAVTLTLADAIIGKYNAYYSDSYHPKPINALTNPDLKLDPKKITAWFTHSYNLSSTQFVGIDTLSKSLETREKIATTVQPSLSFNEDEDEQQPYCVYCQNEYDYDSLVNVEGEGDICQDCLDSDFIFADNTKQYVHNNTSGLHFDETTSEWHDTNSYSEHEICSNCSKIYYLKLENKLANPDVKFTPPIWFSEKDDIYCCQHCIDNTEDDGFIIECYSCGCSLPSSDSPLEWNSHKVLYHSLELKDYEYPDSVEHLCFSCVAQQHSHLCICGRNTPYKEFYKIINPHNFVITETQYSAAYNAIVESAKSHEFDIHDEYNLVVNVSCIHCIHKMMGINVVDSIYEILSENYYSSLTNESLDFFVEMMNSNSTLFGMILKNASFSLAPKLQDLI